MTQDTIKQSYRGVRCLSCRQPIPRRDSLIQMESAATAKESSFLQEHQTRVFSLDADHAIAKSRIVRPTLSTLKAHPSPGSRAPDQAALPDGSRAANPWRPTARALPEPFDSTGGFCDPVFLSAPPRSLGVDPFVWTRLTECLYRNDPIRPITFAPPRNPCKGARWWWTMKRPTAS